MTFTASSSVPPCMFQQTGSTHSPHTSLHLPSPTSQPVQIKNPSHDPNQSQHSPFYEDLLDHLPYRKPLQVELKRGKLNLLSTFCVLVLGDTFLSPFFLSFFISFFLSLSLPPSLSFFTTSFY